MVHKKYFVNSGGANVGPFDMDTIIGKVSQNEIKATDQMYLAEKDQWILICENPEFIEKFKKPKLQSPMAHSPETHEGMGKPAPSLAKQTVAPAAPMVRPLFSVPLNVPSTARNSHGSPVSHIENTHVTPNAHISTNPNAHSSPMTPNGHNSTNPNITPNVHNSDMSSTPQTLNSDNTDAPISRNALGVMMTETLPGLNNSVTQPGMPSASQRDVTVVPNGHDVITLVTNGTTAEWFVLKGKNRYGPFPFLDLIRMLQEKSVFEFDYVWRQGLENWRRIAQLSEFSSENIKGLMKKGNHDVMEVFFRRRHPRYHYECHLIVHDNNKVWKGKTLELSEGGAGVVIDNAMMVPGQNVYLHFKPGYKSKSFNVLCEIVSKKYVKGVREHDAPIIYGVKFINLQKQDRDAIKSMTAA